MCIEGWKNKRFELDCWKTLRETVKIERKISKVDLKELKTGKGKYQFEEVQRIAKRSKKQWDVAIENSSKIISQRTWVAQTLEVNSSRIAKSSKTKISWVGTIEKQQDSITASQIWNFSQEGINV